MKEKEKQNKFNGFTDHFIYLVVEYLEKAFSESFKEIKGDD